MIERSTHNARVICAVVAITGVLIGVVGVWVNAAVHFDRAVGTAFAITSFAFLMIGGIGWLIEDGNS